jgi:hypothetical protein
MAGVADVDVASFVDVNVASVQDYAERLRYANETITLIGRARRQERRLQRAYRRKRDRQDSIDLTSKGSKFAPPEWAEAETRFSDQVYFLIVALRQVLRGRELMEYFGYEMPAFRQAALIQSWRNVEEHWDDPAKGPPIRAMAAWRFESDEVEPGLSHSGVNKLTQVSGLRTKWVRKDLRALGDAVGKVSEREWEHCYLTADDAAAILGITPEALANLEPPPMNLDFEGELGVRYWREAVEARQEGWLIPPRWTDEGWLGEPQ